MTRINSRTYLASRNVLIHAPFVWDGGVAVHIRWLYAELLAQGARATVAAHERLCSALAPIAEMFAHRATLLPLSSAFSRCSPMRALKNWSLLTRKTGRYDVVFCEGYGGTHLLAPTLLSSGGYILLHDHLQGGTFKVCEDSFRVSGPHQYPFPNRLQLALADGVIIGNTIGSTALKALQHVSCPIRVMAPLRPWEVLRSASQRPRRRTRPRLAVFGRLCPQKGIGPLLHVWNNIDPATAELCFYGPDPNGKYEQMSKALGHRNVFFLGPFTAEQLVQLFQEVDAVLVPSLYEGFPIVTFEAIAAGLPLLTTKVGAYDALPLSLPEVICTDINDAAIISGIRELLRRYHAGELWGLRLQRWIVAADLYRSAVESYGLAVASRPEAS